MTIKAKTDVPVTCILSRLLSATEGKSSESVQCAMTGPCLRMRHRPSA